MPGDFLFYSPNPTKYCSNLPRTGTILLVSTGNSSGVAPKQTGPCTSKYGELCVYANIRKYDVQNETKFLQMGLTNVSKFLHLMLKCAKNRSFDWKKSTSELRTSLLSHIHTLEIGCPTRKTAEF